MCVTVCRGAYKVFTLTAGYTTVIWVPVVTLSPNIPDFSAPNPDHAFLSPSTFCVTTRPHAINTTKPRAYHSLSTLCRRMVSKRIHANSTSQNKRVPMPRPRVSA